MLIEVSVKNKIAELVDPNCFIVCGNSDYKIKFLLDEEWNGKNAKTARFVWKNEKGTLSHEEKTLVGDTAEVPVLKNITFVYVGVYSGDLATTTPATIKCKRSILCGDSEHEEPSEDVYNQIIELLNRYISGGSGEIDVRTLQNKTDDNLETESKEVVGAINELNEIAKRADENSQNGTIALETASTANESATMAKETAERAEEKVDALDEIASESLKLASQSFDLAREASENADFAKDRMVEKTEQANQLYGTDVDGNPTLYPTDSVGTQVKVDGQKVKEFNADEKFDKAGGVIGGDVSVQGNLSVSGTTTTKDTETLQVKDNVIVANADGVELVDDSGFAIKTSTTSAYGIMYSPLGDGVKIGLGSFDENGKFVYDEGQAQFLATRADTLTDGNLPQWDNEKKQFVDSGAKIDDYVDKTDFANHINGLFAGVGAVAEGKAPQYTATGTIAIGEAKYSYEATTKGYVDEGFVAKDTVNNNKIFAYGRFMGSDYLFNIAEGATASTLCYRGAGGVVGVGTPKEDNHATNKKYVDDEISKAHALLNKTKLYVHTIVIPDESALIGTTDLTIITSNSTPYTPLALTAAIINDAFYKVLNKGALNSSGIVKAEGGGLMSTLKIYYIYAGSITSKELDLTNATFSCEEF